MARGYQSICPHTMFACEEYAHVHCAGCDEILLGIGGGGDDGRGVGGYEDDHGNSAQLCADCGTESYLCKACFAKSPLCPFCEDGTHAVCGATCDECRTGAA